TAYRLSWPEALTRTVLSQLNLDQWPSPEIGWLRALLLGVVSAAVLLTILLITSRAKEPVRNDTASEWSVVCFGFVWALLGWTVLLFPSIGWQPYYGILGTFGCWIAVGVL